MIILKIFCWAVVCSGACVLHGLPGTASPIIDCGMGDTVKQALKILNQKKIKQ